MFVYCIVDTVYVEVYSFVLLVNTYPILCSTVTTELFIEILCTIYAFV